MIDLSTEFGLRAAYRLRTEQIIWLTTVSSNLAPQPSPVWFLWQDPELLIYSRPGTPKLRNIEHNPRVSLHFDGDGRGGDIIIFTGEARIDEQAPPANAVPAYVEKYTPGFARIRVTAEQFTKNYSVAIRVALTGVRGH